jgi:hypothetical protein
VYGRTNALRLATDIASLMADENTNQMTSFPGRSISLLILRMHALASPFPSPS